MTDMISELQNDLGKSLLSVSSPADRRWFLEMENQPAVRRAIEILARYPMARLITVSCVDSPAYLELLYHVDTEQGIVTIRSKVWKPANCLSVSGIMPAAELIEHEITEMFGLAFEGNPRPDNMILSDSQNELKPLRNRATSLETRMDGNVANLVEHGSTTAPSKRVMKSRSAIGMPENPPLCSITCPGKNIVFEIAESAGTVARHPNLKKEVSE